MSSLRTNGALPDHAALMDSVYRRQRHIYDFTRKYYLFGRDRLIRELNLSPADRVVEVGCGTARNLVLMAKHYPSAKLFGLDASAEMLRTAGRTVAGAGLGDRIHLVQGLAEDLVPDRFGMVAFDHVVFSYSLSMIQDWRQALRVAAGALSPAGKIHVVDFGDLKGLGRAGRSAMLAWLRFFYVTPRVELFEAFQAIGDSVKNINELRVLPGHYAFVASCSAQAALRVAGNSVAA